MTQEGFLLPSDPARVTYRSFREIYGSDERIVIAATGPDVFAPEFLGRLRALHGDLESTVPHLASITSLVNARDTEGVGDTLVVGELAGDWPVTRADFERLRERALANPLYRGVLFDDALGTTALLLELDAFGGASTAEDAPDAADPLTAAHWAEDGASGPSDADALSAAELGESVQAVEAILSRHVARDFRLEVAGSVTLQHGWKTSMQRDVRRFLAIGLGVSIAMLALLFRRLSGVVLPIALVGCTLVATFGAMGLLGIPFQVPTQVMPNLLFAIGIANSVHVLVLFYQALDAGARREDAIVEALRDCGVAVVLTALTTIGALCSFATVGITPIANLGRVAPGAVALSLVYTLTLLPALLALAPIRARRGTRRGGADRATRVLDGLARFASRRARAIALAALALAIVSAIGAARIRFSHDTLEWFPEDHRLVHATRMLDDRLRGTAFLEVLVDGGHPNALHEPRLLRALDELSRSIESSGPVHTRAGAVFVGKATSIADVVKEIHQALDGNRPESHRIPDARAAVAQELLLFESAGSDDLEDWSDGELRRARMTLKLPWRDAIVYAPFVDAIEARPPVATRGPRRGRPDRQGGAARGHPRRDDPRHGALLPARLRGDLPADDAPAAQRPARSAEHAPEPAADPRDARRDGLRPEFRSTASPCWSAASGSVSPSTTRSTSCTASSEPAPRPATPRAPSRGRSARPAGRSASRPSCSAAASASSSSARWSPPSASGCSPARPSPWRSPRTSCSRRRS